MSERRQAAEDLERTRVDAPEVSWALRGLYRAVVEADAELARRLELRHIDYQAMDHLMDEPGVLGPADLSHRLGISTGSATELVDRLERAGHVRRAPHPTDRRRVVLEPTDSAVAGVLGQLAPLFGSLDALAAQFSDAERAVITRYLRSAADRVDDFVSSPREHGS